MDAGNHKNVKLYTDFASLQTITSEMDTIDASSCGHEEISKETIIKNNIAIQNFQLDDLFYLEKDLDFYEKVSVH